MAKRSKMSGAKAMANAMNRTAPALNRPINAASRKALQPMLRQSKANTPHKSVKKALVIRRDPNSRSDILTHVVGGNPKNPDYRLLHLLEFGTAPHMIKGWMHPGSRKQPFLRPAFEATKDQVIEVLGKEIGPELEKQAARMAKKKARK